MKRQLTVAAFALFLMVAGASAHEVEVMYDRREPVELAVHYQKMTTVAFWDVISNVSTTVPATVLDIRKDPMFPHTITIANLQKKTRGMVYVTLSSGVVVHLDVRHWGEVTQKVIVKDARTEAERAVQQAAEKSGMTAEERTVRALWAAQWGFATDALVQVTEANQVLERNDQREVILTKRYETVGFTGFTQSVRNLTLDTMRLHPSTIKTNCDLLSVSLDAHEPPLEPGDDPYEVPFAGSVSVHLVCKGARDAAIR